MATGNYTPGEVLQILRQNRALEKENALLRARIESLQTDNRLLREQGYADARKPKILPITRQGQLT